MSDDMGIFTLYGRRRLRRVLFGFGVFVVIGLVLRASWLPPHDSAITDISTSGPKAFVVASMKKDDTNWIQEHLPGWNLIRYVVDDPKAQYTVPKNKGREAMVYLTYIIDHYDKLPDVMVFMHSERYQWHNDDPIYDGVTLLQSLQLPYLISQGYTNLRCVWTLGCPAELKLTELPQEAPSDPKSAKTTEFAYPAAFKALFPGEDLPDVVGVACCAQFALTRQKIRERPISDYHRYRNWIMNTHLEDHVSGRVLEYSWHIIFGRPAVHCPNAKVCYCKVYGLCGLECSEEGKCGERWPFPPFSTLPNGWPGIGWDGEVMNEEKLDELRKSAMKNGLA
ncbi:hypothetical protein F5882DRAFT_112436 [Hyaloscypha sp. PMI_1271]|nr:hypothetical protein F5882DRAFT_112436 [Hyaloscypha sp. PMI_1271]